MRYIKMTYPDINNGPGCRVTLWLPGCTHKCKGCHNKQLAEYNQGRKFTNDTLDKLGDILSKDYISGITISGGDPLDQSDEILLEIRSLTKWVKRKFNKSVWIYTGYYIGDLNKQQLKTLKYCDFLVDGPFILDKRDVTLPFRGSENQRIINLKNYFENEKDCI